MIMFQMITLHVFQECFLLLASEFLSKNACRSQFAPVSLFYLEESSRIRHITVWITLWPWFERFILAVILLNTITLAITGTVPCCIVIAHIIILICISSVWDCEFRVGGGLFAR